MSEEKPGLKEELESQLQLINDEIAKRMQKYQRVATSLTTSSSSSSSNSLPSSSSSNNSQIMSSGGSSPSPTSSTASTSSTSSPINTTGGGGSAAATTTKAQLAFKLLQRTAEQDHQGVAAILDKAKEGNIELFTRNSFDADDVFTGTPAPSTTSLFNPTSPAVPLSSPVAAITTSHHPSTVADLAQRDLDGQTPLHIAASKGDAKLVSMLLEYGMLPDTEDETECTPIDIAREAGFNRVVRLLEEAEKRLKLERSNSTNSSGSNSSSNLFLTFANSTPQNETSSSASSSSHSKTTKTTAAAASTSGGRKELFIAPSLTVAVSGASSPQGSEPSSCVLPASAFAPHITGLSSSQNLSTSSSSSSATAAAASILSPNSGNSQQHNNSHLTALQSFAEQHLRGVIILVGLPARGKTYFARRVQRFFMFKGAEVRSFSAGDVRRSLYPQVSRSNVSTEQAEKISDAVALQAASFVLAGGGTSECAAIIDGMNHTRALRKRIFSSLCSHGVPPTAIVFLEVVVSDESLVEKHIENAVEDFIIGDRNVHPCHFNLDKEKGSSKGENSEEHEGEQQLGEEQNNNNNNDFQSNNNNTFTVSHTTDRQRLPRRPTMYDIAQSRSSAPARPKALQSESIIDDKKEKEKEEGEGKNSGDHIENNNNNSSNNNQQQEVSTSMTPSSSSATAAASSLQEGEGEEDASNKTIYRTETAETFRVKYRSLIEEMTAKYETMNESEEGGLCFARSVNRSLLLCHNLAYTPLGRALARLLIDIRESDKRFFVVPVGETLAAREGRFGVHGSPLSPDVGVEYSEKVAEYLARQIPPGSIANNTTILCCSSTGGRKTLAPFLNKYVAQHIALKSIVRYLHTLDDLNYGDCDGLTAQEAASAFPRHTQIMTSTEHLSERYAATWPRGESFQLMMQMRLEQHISELEAVTNQNIILVVPRSVAQALLLYFDPARFPTIRPEEALTVEVPSGQVICLTGNDREAPEWEKL